MTTEYGTAVILYNKPVRRGETENMKKLFPRIISAVCVISILFSAMVITASADTQYVYVTGTGYINPSPADM